MRIKKMMIAIAGIMIVLGLNAIATAIDNPEVYTKPLPDPVPVARLETNNHIDKMANKERMKRLGVTDLYDPEQNITLGCDILSELVNKYGNYRDALSVYNSGNTVEGREYADKILSNARNQFNKHRTEDN